MDKERILLHICCAPDATAVFERLQKEYEVIGFFHNPNIYPPDEYVRRRDEARRVAQEMGFILHEGDSNPDKWKENVRGLEHEPEKGLRCEKCFEHNLRATAAYTAQNGIGKFTTTLTISPHKRSEVLFRIGRQAGQMYGVEFLEIDFKKQDGFKRSLSLSKEMQLYRQHYCGCEYSMPGSRHA